MLRAGSILHYTKGYKYQSEKDFVVWVRIYPLKDIVTDHLELTKEGRLLLKKSYAWDGPSGPTKDTEETILGSFVHDGLYQLMRMGRLSQNWREQADKEAYRIWLESNKNVCSEANKKVDVSDEIWLAKKIIKESNRARMNVNKVRFLVWYKALRIAAAGAASPKNKKEVFTAF